MTNESNNFPNNKGHIEIQQQLLTSLQQEISTRLFVSGAVSRIVGVAPPKIGAKTDVEGFAILDKTFVPAFSYLEVDSHKQRILSLQAITQTDAITRSFGFTHLGEVDEQGFLHVFDGIPEDDAWAVYSEARELERLRDGDTDNPPTLPQLNTKLTAIENPHTSISVRPNIAG